MNLEIQKQALERQLQENMTQEVLILRNMLTSIQEEQRAILTCNLGSWEQVIEDRLFPAEKYQQLTHLIKETIGSLCLLLNKELPCEELNHEMALDMLTEIVGIENCEIPLLKSQIVSLLQEIHQQNHLSAYFLHNHPMASMSHSRHPGLRNTLKREEKKIKKKLLVLDSFE